MRQQITVKDAAELLGRGTRRVYQLLETGYLAAGDFYGTVLTVSVMRYKRGIDNGSIRAGRPRRNPAPRVKAELRKNGKKR